MSLSRQGTGPLHQLYSDLKNGELDRRRFVESASWLGVSLAGAAFLANTAAPVAAAAQESSPEATAATHRPDAGTEGQGRGAGGQLRLIQWQAPGQLSPHVATGLKDYLASALVLEPLMHYLPDSSLIPNLVREVPTVENGLLAADLTTVTYHLLPDVTWNDGEPFTADDVVFTWKWVMNTENASVNIASFEAIKSIEATDPLTAVVTFNGPNPLWFEPHAGTSTGFVYPKHVLESGTAAHDAFRIKPTGTGPFKVDSFSPNDQVEYSANEHYREANKPFFTRVVLKGGGDAASAARAVIQTGEYDYAWNLQVEPEILRGMESDNAPGKLLIGPDVTVDRIELNLSDPNKEVDGQKSEMNTPHPFFSDIKVRQALATAIDREKIANTFWFGQDGEPAVSNILEGIPAIQSPNNHFEFDTEKASQILEDAGWVKDGDTRAKNGVNLHLTYTCSVNQVNQKMQALVKSNLEAIGFKVSLNQVDPNVLFDGSPGNEQNIQHFYWDMEMFTQSLSSPRPFSFMRAWYAGKDGSNIAQKSNQWVGQNYSRFRSDEYDRALDQARSETDPEAIAQLFIKMNDIVIQNHVEVPLLRVGQKVGISKKLNAENIALGPFSTQYWNIANWNFLK